VTWQVRWSNKAQRTVSRLDRPTQKRITDAVAALAANGAGDVKQLHGASKELYRLRVGGWRVLFAKEQGTFLLINAVRRRGDAY
jgi:mRNA-degrading endonuclease RelE of RelBE toxin-antitoxin system